MHFPLFLIDRDVIFGVMMPVNSNRIDFYPATHTIDIHSVFCHSVVVHVTVLVCLLVCLMKCSECQLIFLNISFISAYQYAMISMKIVLANLLMHYTFSTKLKLTELQFKFEVTMKPATENLISLQRRQ